MEIKVTDYFQTEVFNNSFLIFLYLTRSELQIKVIALVRNLEYFGPTESINAQMISEYEETRGAHTNEYIDAVGVLGIVQVHAIHGQLDRILQIVHFGLGGRLTLVVLVAVGYGRQQLGILIGRKAEALQVLVAARLGIARHLVEVAQLGLYRKRAEKCVCDESAGQFAVHDVVA